MKGLLLHFVMCAVNVMIMMLIIIALMEMIMNTELNSSAFNVYEL